MSRFVLAVDVGGNVGGDRWLRFLNDEDSDLWGRPCHSHFPCYLRVSSFLPDEKVGRKSPYDYLSCSQESSQKLTR